MGRSRKYSDTEFDPFVLDDGTGTAFVDPSDADVVLSDGDEIAVEGGEQPPEFVREFLERETSVEPVGRRKRWYTEYRLDGEARVAGHTDPDIDPGLEHPPTTAVVEAGDAPKFVVTDDHDLTLGKRMLQEALLYFLVGGLLLVIAAWPVISSL